MLLPKTISLETKRLLLRTPQLTDAPVMMEILNDLKTMQHLKFMTETGREWTLEKTQARIKNQLEQQNNDKSIILNILHKETDTLIGATGFPQLDLVNKTAVSGIILFHSYWKQGLATEAFFALFEYGFNMLGLVEVKFYTIATNVRMCNFFEKFGIPLESANSDIANPLDHSTQGDLVYTLHVSNWPAVKSNLMQVK